MNEFSKAYGLAPSVAEFVVNGYYQKLRSEPQDKVDQWFEWHFPEFKKYLPVVVG